MEIIGLQFSETICVAILVINGKYGNGEERKEKLKKDGFDAEKVQQCVNELLPLIEKYK